MQMEQPIDFETARKAWFAEQRRRRLRERRRPWNKLVAALMIGIGVGAALTAAGASMLWPERNGLRHTASISLTKTEPMRLPAKDQSRIPGDASVRTSEPVGGR